MTMGQRTQSSFLKYFFLVGVFFICTLVILFKPPPIKFVEGAWCQTEIQPRGLASSQNGLEGKTTGGIVGDPSHKRGFVLGYDAGPRAGSEDKAQNKNPDPSLRPEYNKPDQFYRYEYGSRASFIAGFRRGFLRGYKSSFDKMELKHSETIRETVSVDFPSSRKARIESVRTLEPLPNKINLAEDAL